MPLALLVLGGAPALAQDEFRQRREPEPGKADGQPSPRLTKAPVLTTFVAPAYPPDALAARQEADVTLQIDIDAQGRVAGVVVTGSAGQEFDEAAVSAAARFEFEPAEIDGRPGAIRIAYVLRFRPPPLSAPEVPPGAALPIVEAPPGPPPRLVARGRARERGTRDPVTAADVSLVGLGDTGAAAGALAGDVVASTDDGGRFVVTTALTGRARLVLSDGEHEPCIRELELPAPGQPPIEIDCLVARRRGRGYETVVTGERRGEEITRHTLSRPELTSVPGTFGDPLRVIETLPGVARAPYGLGLLIIRGSSPQDSGVYVDGHRVPLLYHFLGGPSVLTPELIKRVDFFPGGFGVRYGRATGGIIDVATRDEAVKRMHGSADVDVLDSSVYLEAPLPGEASASVAARRSYVDALLPLVLPAFTEGESSSVAVVAPVYWDYQARVSKDLGAEGRVSLFAFGSNDSLEVVAASDSGAIELGTRIGFHHVIGSWRRNLGAWTSHLSPSYGYDLFSFSTGAFGGEAAAHVFSLRQDLERPLTPSLRLAVGLDASASVSRLDFDVPLQQDRRLYGFATRDNQSVSRDFFGGGGGVYAEALWDVAPRLRLVPGLRADWFRSQGEDRASVDPRVVVRFARTSTQILKAGAGVFHQPPEPNELDAEFGNPALSMLWADQYHVGIEQGLTRALWLDATLYYLRRHDLPIASNRVTGPGRIERYASEGRGRGYGLELRLRHEVTSDFFGWISYTLSRSEIRDRLPSPAEPAPGYHPTDFDQTHNLIAVASRRVGAWELGLRFRLVSGVPETRILGGSYDADYDNYRAIMGEPNAARRQLFHQLDLRAERTWTFDAWQLSAYLDLMNTYNAENPEATIYDYRFRKSAPVRGMPILPVLGVRGRF